MVTKETYEVKSTATRYVTTDGSIFPSESMANDYENSYKGTMSVMAMEIPHARMVNAVDYNIPYASEDWQSYIFKPRNVDDIKILNAWMEACVNGSYFNFRDEHRLTQKYIGKEILITFGYDADFVDVYLLEERLKTLKRNISDVYEYFDDMNNESESESKSESESINK